MEQPVPEWFIVQIATLAAGYASWKPTEATYRLFWGVLHDVEPEAIQRAILAHASTGKFPPTPADLLELSGDADDDTATDAWEEMRAHRVKYAQTRYNATPYVPQWSSEAVRRASEAVCWRDPDWTTEQLPTLRAQFERHYNALRTVTRGQEVREEATAKLPEFRKFVGGTEDGPRRLMDGAG